MLDVRTLNRNRTISLYCMLTGCYEKFCEATKLSFKGSGDGRHAVYENAGEANAFLSYITPAVERFCDGACVNTSTWNRGNAYRNGCSPDNYPHPIAVAIAIKHRRGAVKESLKRVGCEDVEAEIRRVYALMKIHNMVEEQ